MADVPETNDGTSGPLAWLLVGPLVALMVAVPFLVFTAVLSVALAAIDSVVGLPVVTLGLFEAVGLPATVLGVPLLYSVVPSLLASLGLLASAGLDWEGTDSSGGGSVGSRWR